MTEDTDCEFKNNEFYPCKGLGAMIDSRNVTGVGAAICHLFNFKTGEESDAGVYFQFTKEAAKQVTEMGGKTQLMFNVCPFCRKEIYKK